MEAHQMVATTPLHASAALLPLDESVSDVFKASILDRMAHDEISFIVR